MSHVFISYSRKNLDIALDVERNLKAQLFPTWLDIHDIKTGDEWKKYISGAIETCSALVVLLTPQSERSFWVMREVTYALELGKPVFPLMHNGYCFPLFEDIQCADSTNKLIQDISQVEGLGRLLQLFICHADDEFAMKLVEDLTKLDARICQDVSQEGLDTSQIMLLIVSPESMQSTDIREQWEAFQRDGKTIIPVSVKQTPVPVKLREMQPYIDFLNQDYQIAFGQLCGHLAASGVRLKDHEKISIPPQPKLPLDGYDMVNQAQRDVWISGLTLDIFTRRPDIFYEALARRSELNIRLLMLDLDSQVANETGRWVGIDERRAGTIPYSSDFESWAKCQTPPLTEAGRWVASRLYQNRTILKDICRQAPNRVEIRTIPFRMGVGYFIIDPFLDEGMLTATPYYYLVDFRKGIQQGVAPTSPVFLSKKFSKGNDLWWFEQYVQEFEWLWKDAVLWNPG